MVAKLKLKGIDGRAPPGVNACYNVARLGPSMCPGVSDLFTDNGARTRRKPG